MLSIYLDKGDNTSTRFEVRSLEDLILAQSEITRIYYENATETIKRDLEVDDDFRQDVLEQALSGTDYDSIEDMVDAIKTMSSAMDDIYNSVREFV